MVIEFDPELRKRSRAKRAALQEIPDPRPTIALQKDILSNWAGKGVQLDTWPLKHPVDPIEGLLVSMRENGRIVERPTTYEGVTTTDGGSAFEVSVTTRAIDMKSEHKHLQGLVIDVVPFTWPEFKGSEYMRVFRHYQDEYGNRRDFATFLYQRDEMQSGIWTLRTEHDIMSRSKQWLLREQEPEEFLEVAARNYVRHKRISVERFGFNVEPDRLETPPRPIFLPTFRSLRRTKAA